MTLCSLLQLRGLMTAEREDWLTMTRSELSDDNNHEGILLDWPVHSRARSAVGTGARTHQRQTFIPFPLLY